MQRLRTYWSSGWRGKLALIAAATCGGLFACCVLGLTIGALAPRPAATAPTISPAAVARPTTQEVEPTNAPEPEATEMPSSTVPPAPTVPPDRKTVRAADYGDTWPFTVESGIVRCVAPKNEVVFSSGGKAYAVNGTAKANKLYADIDSIWKDDPSIAGAKINIAPILDLGLSLCK